ncbi:zinc-ribbon domain-containing protein [[Clostridium] aminophilum]|uniref:Zinc-ribbon domain-containing protein n=2 Tax=[Clostridium] aminophilum TaxID=1526 RepID=A0A1I0C3R0_9FIRM|nr:zinc-ribbon domain-containing protein [[Clostridium] aminophilum]
MMFNFIIKTFHVQGIFPIRNRLNHIPGFLLFCQKPTINVRNSYGDGLRGWNYNKFDLIISYYVREDNTMKCPNCGATVRDGSLFCDDCGYKFETATTDSAFTHGIPNAEEIPKKKTGKKILLVIGGAAFIGTVAFFTANLLKPDSVRFIELQEKAIKSAYLDPVEALSEPVKDKIDTELTLTAKISGAKISDILAKTALVLKMNRNGHNGTMNISFRYNNSDILTGLLCTDGRKLDIAVPSLNKKVYSSNIVTMVKNLTGNGDAQIHSDSITELALSNKKQKEIAQRYISLLNDILSDQNLTVEKNQNLDFSVSAITSADARYALDGKSFTKYTFVPTEEDYKTLMQKLSETMEKDTYLKNWYIKCQEYGKLAFPQMPTYDEILSTVNDDGGQMSRNLAASELKWTVYADAKQARYIRIESKNYSTLEMAFANDGTQTANIITFGDGFSFCNSFTKSGSVYSGSISFNDYKLSYNNVDTSKSSILGLFVGSYSAEGVTMDVRDADNANDYEVKFMGTAINLHATKTSTVVPPEGDVVDISDYTKEDYQNLAMELRKNFYQLMMSDPNLQELLLFTFINLF